MAESEGGKLTNESVKKFLNKAPSVKRLDKKQHQEFEKF